MRRLGAVIVILVVAVAARFALRRPASIDLDLGYGPRAATLREVDLVFTRADDHVERELKLLYAAGAPGRDRKSLRLPRGGYSVGARLSWQARPETTVSRHLEVDGEGTYTLDLD